MRIDEFTNDKQKLELLKLIIDNVWASFEQDAEALPEPVKVTKQLKPLQSKPRSKSKTPRKLKVVSSRYKRPPPIIPTWPKQPVKTDTDSTISSSDLAPSTTSTKTGHKTKASITKSPYKPYPNPYLSRNPYAPTSV